LDLDRGLLLSAERAHDEEPALVVARHRAAVA
jgi:hypothetical protein